MLAQRVKFNIKILKPEIMNHVTKRRQSYINQKPIKFVDNPNGVCELQSGFIASPTDLIARNAAYFKRILTPIFTKQYTLYLTFFTMFSCKTSGILSNMTEHNHHKTTFRVCHKTAFRVCSSVASVKSYIYILYCWILNHCQSLSTFSSQTFLSGPLSSGLCMVWILF